MVAAASISAGRLQTVKGLLYAGLIAGGWLGLHGYALFVFELTLATLPYALIMAVMQCWLSVGVFIISHDAMHGTLAPRRPKVNAAIGATLLFLYAGFSWKRMRSAHFAHHKHAGGGSDPDFDTGNPADFLRWYTTFLRRYFGWRSAAFISTVVTSYWLVLGIPMAQIVLLYGLPAIASSMQLFYFGTFRPHRHEAGGFADRHNARSETFPELISLATCFHFGYHLEHHRRPDLPWWALPGARGYGSPDQGPPGNGHEA